MLFISKLKKLLRLQTRAPDESQETALAGTKPEQNISLTNQKPITMSMFNYGVGGNEVKVDANEAVQDIQENKTLLVSKLTQEEPVNPEVITGLKTVEDVFRHFKPSLTISHEDTDGAMVRENFHFTNLGDFTPKGITQQSKYLNELSLQQEQYNKIVRQSKTNKILRSMLENEASKEAFITALKAVAEELESNTELQ